MNAQMIQKAAALLAHARRSREPLERLPEDCRPATVDDALAIQEALVSTLGERTAGWKVARLPGGELAYGIIVGSRVVNSGGTLDARDAPLLGMESEIAFRFVKDAPPRGAAYSYEDVADRVVAFAAIEVVATRYRDYRGTPVIERGADFMSNGAFVVGADQPRWRTMDLVHIPVSIAFDDLTIVERTGGHATGDPLLLAVDLTNALRATTGVRAGQVMTTGTYTGLQFAQRGQTVTARFEGFAPVSVRIV
jgi:2-keto-4-pentenoate hydratase